MSKSADQINELKQKLAEVYTLRNQLIHDLDILSGDCYENDVKLAQIDGYNEKIEKLKHHIAVREEAAEVRANLIDAKRKFMDRKTRTKKRNKKYAF